MLPVPRDCTANSAMMTRMESGRTKRVKAGETTSSPSTADRTEMAGVMTPSPKNRAGTGKPDQTESGAYAVVDRYPLRQRHER